MTDYFIDDGGDNTDGLSWATAFHSFGDMQAVGGGTGKSTSGNLLASTDRVIIGADSTDTYSYGATLVVYGPAGLGNLATEIISSTVGSGTTVAYSAATADQIKTAGTSYGVTFDGSFSLRGVQVSSGERIRFLTITYERSQTEFSKFKPGHNSYVEFGASGLSGHFVIRDCTIDGSNDTGAATSHIVDFTGAVCNDVLAVTFANVSNRNTLLVYGNLMPVFIGGLDCSAVPDSTPIFGIRNSLAHYSNIKTSATHTFSVNTGGMNVGSDMTIVNYGASNSPWAMYHRQYRGLSIASDQIYRSNGAVVEGTSCAWNVSSTSQYTAENTPYRTPWIYGTVSSTGSKTFDVYITNDTADFTDAEVWLEVQFGSESTEAMWGVADNHRTISDSATNHTDDTGSTWNGTGPSFTYKQKLSVTATVNQTGMFRARVYVAVPSIAGGRYFYIDPLVTVT